MIRTLLLVAVAIALVYFAVAALLHTTPAEVGPASSSAPARAEALPEVRTVAPPSVQAGRPEQERSKSDPTKVSGGASVESARALTKHSLAVPAGILATDPVSRSAELSKLLNSTRIECSFDLGNGGNWPSGNVQTHNAAWQGGPITFEAIDVEAGKAKMTGSVGATGSLEGEADMRLTATDAGLHFMGFTIRGELVITSVYSSYDGTGKYRAVMSRHATEFANESAQFYGTCTTR